MPGKNYALLIGIRTYPNIPPSRGGTLNGCHNDVQVVYDELTRRGFDELRVLVDRMDDCECPFCRGERDIYAVPKRQGIRDALEQLLSDVTRDDLVTFYFSGHGSEIKGKGLFAGQVFQTIVTHDSGRGDAPNLDIADREMESWIRRLGEAAHSATWIFDNCYSGGMASLRSASKPETIKQVEADDRGVEALHPDLAQSLTLSPGIERPRAIVLSACAAAELSSETRVEDRPQGLFTARLLDALQKDEATRWSEIFPGVAESVKKENLHQSPRREGDGPIFARGEIDPQDVFPDDAIELKKYAVVIGIDYQGAVPNDTFSPLQAPVVDAKEVARVLEEDQGYEIVGLSSKEPGPLLNEKATRQNIHLILHRLARIKVRRHPDSAVVIYFAGHGISRQENDVPQGYLVPWDGTDDRSTWIPMSDLRDQLIDGISEKDRLEELGVSKSLMRLTSRHLLLVLDCCFGGAISFDFFRSGARRERPIYFSEYKRFIEGPAWQLLTSASFNQQALDRDPRDPSKIHSPFAEALIEALSSHRADLSVDGRRDHVITAGEVHGYIDTQLRRAGVDIQTPGLIPLRPLRGHFVFHVPGFKPSPQPDPPLDPMSDPWRDDENHFSERPRILYEILHQLASSKRPTALIGPSGSGKSRLLQDGLKPLLENVDPTDPTGFLAQTGLGALLDPDLARPDRWIGADSISEAEARLTQLTADQRILLILDPASGQENIDSWIDDERVQILATMRRDPGEPWTCVTLSRPSTEELRSMIEVPAAVNVLFFDPPNLVAEIIDEAAEGASPAALINAALSEMYQAAWKRRAASDRELTRQDLPEGIAGMLARRAEELIQEFDDRIDLIRRIFLRLTVPEAGRPCRPAELDEIKAYMPSMARNIEEIVDRFVEKHVLVLGERLEIAHPGLVTSWPRIAEWKRKAYDLPALWVATSKRAAVWEASGRRSGKLWFRDPAIYRLLESKDLSLLEREFIEASFRANRERLAQVFSEMSSFETPDEDWPRKLLLAAAAADTAADSDPRIRAVIKQSLLNILHVSPLSVSIRIPGQIVGMKFLETDSPRLVVRTLETAWSWNLARLAEPPEEVDLSWVLPGEGESSETSTETHTVRLRKDGIPCCVSMLRDSIPKDLDAFLFDPTILLGFVEPPRFIASVPLDDGVQIALAATRRRGSEIRLWRLEDLIPMPADLNHDGLQRRERGEIEAIIVDELVELRKAGETYWKSREKVECLELSLDGKTLAYASKFGIVRIAPTDAPGLHRPLVAPSRVPASSPVRSLEFLPDGALIIRRVGRTEICPLDLDTLILLARGAAGRSLRPRDMPLEIWREFQQELPPPGPGQKPGAPPPQHASSGAPPNEPRGEPQDRGPRGDRSGPHGDRPGPNGDRSRPRGDRSGPNGDRSGPHGGGPQGDRSGPHGGGPQGDRSGPHGGGPRGGGPRGGGPPELKNTVSQSYLDALAAIRAVPSEP